MHEPNIDAMKWSLCGHSAAKLSMCHIPQKELVSCLATF